MCFYVYNVFLYPYRIIFLFYNILVLHNHTKTHILVFYLILVLKVLNITLKFSRNAKVTRSLTGQRPLRPAADDDFEV